MADYYESAVVHPMIPNELITQKIKSGIREANGRIEEGEKTSYIFFEDSVGGGEVTEEDVIDLFIEIIKSSNGKLPWIAIEKSFTCSKMRPDGFGGSACFITADDVRYMSTSSWLGERSSEVSTRCIRQHSNE